MHLRVEHVMARDVITVHEDCTLAEAAALMRNCEVSGMPVVDKYGRCVGVLSATDFVACKTEELPNHAPAVRMAATVDCAGRPHAVAIDANTVRAHMSPRVETIREHSPLVDAGQMMCRAHIHRLIVVDRQNHPIGVVSSLDLVSALVHAIEEAQRSA
jgi:CBS-domain-containing membrane protein